jgi:hypothetical protein
LLQKISESFQPTRKETLLKIAEAFNKEADRILENSKI